MVSSTIKRHKHKRTSLTCTHSFLIALCFEFKRAIVFRAKIKGKFFPNTKKRAINFSDSSTQNSSCLSNAKNSQSLLFISRAFLISFFLVFFQKKNFNFPLSFTEKKNHRIHSCFDFFFFIYKIFYSLLHTSVTLLSLAVKKYVYIKKNSRNETRLRCLVFKRWTQSKENVLESIGKSERARALRACVCEEL